MVLKRLAQVCSRVESLPLKKWLLAPVVMPFVTSAAVTASLLGLQSVGALQQAELKVFDTMVRRRPELGPDPRLLVVSITEADIQRQGRWPLSDQTVADALQRLQQHQPRLIGLDVYRDVPQMPGRSQLLKALQAENTIAITNLGSGDDAGVPAPEGLPTDRVGFNDLLIDSDNVVRRHLMIASVAEETYFSFPLLLAIAYLDTEGQTARNSPSNPNHLQIGETVFEPLQATSGGYAKVDARGYQLLINYRSGRQSVRQISLTQLLNGEFDPAWVRDKVVLVGTTASSQKDVFYTPFSASEEEIPEMPGVLVHAQMLSQILDAVAGDRPLFRYWTPTGEGLWLWGWAIAGGVLAWRVRHPALLLSGAAGVLVLLGMASFSLFEAHAYWVPTIAPALGLVLTGSLVVAHRAYEAHQQQQTVMRLLGQSTSPEVAAALWTSRDRLLKSGKLPGQKLTATTMFVDIKNFSTISEMLLPELLLEWLNTYLAAATQEVLAHQGVVNKFTGDGLMAVFGVPVPRQSEAEIAADARNAVRCALVMGDRLRAMNQLWREQGLPLIEIRAGIFTGPVVAGSLGSKERLEYGVIGDSVNIAARLESCEKDRQGDVCRVLIAKETLVYLNDEFEVDHWGPLALKGKHHLVDVYRVIGLARSPQPRQPAEPPTALN